MGALHWFEDPAHGWLRVPLAELGGFVPSGYSYRDSKHAFLEEDCDALGWATHVGRVEEAKAAEVTHHAGSSPIRRKATFEHTPDEIPVSCIVLPIGAGA